MNRNCYTLEQAKAAGYCITSRAYRTASRLDRADWKQKLASTHVDGMAWVECLGDQSAADHYRRCLTRDQITVPSSWIKELGNSGSGPDRFLPLPI
jgi:hypothetical protein